MESVASFRLSLYPSYPHLKDFRPIQEIRRWEFGGYRGVRRREEGGEVTEKI